MLGRGEFDENWFVEFRRIVGENEGLDALRADLTKIGRRYRRVIEATPCDLPGAPYNKTLTQRIDWLDAQVLSPCERLLAALEAEKSPMFSTWPYEHEFPDAPDRSSIRDSVSTLHAFATRLRRNLASEQQADAGTSQEIRAMIYYDALEAVKRHLPNLKPSRGVYDPELDRYVGRFPEAMRHIYREITGLDEQIVRLIDTFKD